MDYYRKHRGAVTLTAAGVLAIIILFFLAGVLLTISALAGFASGSLILWLTGGLRDYPDNFIDIRDTD